jgi:hypothetical protein
MKAIPTFTVRVSRLAREHDRDGAVVLVVLNLRRI